VCGVDDHDGGLLHASGHRAVEQGLVGRLALGLVVRVAFGLLVLLLLSSSRLIIRPVEVARRSRR
jgi:hypothetical protein